MDCFLSSLSVTPPSPSLTRDPTTSQDTSLSNNGFTDGRPLTHRNHVNISCVDALFWRTVNGARSRFFPPVRNNLILCAKETTHINRAAVSRSATFKLAPFTREILCVKHYVNKSKISVINKNNNCLLYTSPSPRDRQKSRMPSSA